MFARFIDWTTQLNATDPLAFATVTVLTMATVGVAIAMVAELLLSRHAKARPGTAADPHAPGH